jgi:hypothetical protein
MGSFDTSETVSRDSYREPPRSRRRETDETPSTPRVPRTSDDAAVTPEPDMDYDRPTLVSVGGGLTPARIVKKVDTSYLKKPTIEVINYLISDEVATTKEEKNIADAVRERMTKPDYRAIINDFYNFHNERLHSDHLKEYLTTKERQSEGGTLKYNFTDIAIVTHEEGGNKKMGDLEKKCST